VVLNKVFGILRRELSAEEYVTYFQMVTSRIGDATKELREKTKDLRLDEVIEGAEEIEKRGGRSEG
jgi:chemotaxis regulatin CheY-phosphate phosphatase CheZ